MKCRTRTFEHSNNNKIKNVVPPMNAIIQNIILLEDEMNAMKTSMRKLKDDNINILQNLKELRIAINNKF